MFAIHQKVSTGSRAYRACDFAGRAITEAAAGPPHEASTRCPGVSYSQVTGVPGVEVQLRRRARASDVAR
jgi:hypothetical protein